MSKRQLQSATTFNVLIVAKADPEAALVAETLRAAPMSFCIDIGLTVAACKTLLAQNRYDAIVGSEEGESEALAADILSLVQESGREIPTLWMVKDLESLAKNLRDRMADCIGLDRLSCLPAVLQHRLLPPSTALANDLARSFQNAPNLEAFLQDAARLSRETLAIRCCAIVQREGGAPKLTYSTAESSDRAESLNALEAAAARHYEAILRSGSPLTLRNGTPIPPAANSESRGNLLFVPLTRPQSDLGVLGLYHQSEEHQWTEAELNWVNAIAAYCSIALESQRCNQQLQQQQSCQHLLHQVGVELNSIAEVETRFENAIARIGEHFAVDRVLLMRMRETDIWVEREWRARATIPSALHARIPRADWPELGARERNGIISSSFQIADLVEFCRDKEESHRIVSQSQAKSTICIPIFVRDLLFGWLLLQTTLSAEDEGCISERTFTPEEINLLVSLATQIALAAAALQEESRLQQEVEQRTQEIESANRAKSEFLSTMSHELRAPLTSVIGFARVLLERIYGELNTKQVQYITAIAESGEHLLSLIEDLLDISKIEANKEELYLETLSVEEVCRSSVSLMHERAQQAGLQLCLELHPSVTVCYADRRRLKQILVNLLSNAIKFTPTGSVTLKVEPEDRQIAFSVIDTGIGIEEVDLQTLFQPFQQIQTPLHRKHKGSGLGLALSRKLARLHGGDLVGTSVVGEGSCFTLSLPRAELPSSP